MMLAKHVEVFKKTHDHHRDKTLYTLGHYRNILRSQFHLRNNVVINKPKNIICYDEDLLEMVWSMTPSKTIWARICKV